MALAFDSGSTRWGIAALALMNNSNSIYYCWLEKVEGVAVAAGRKKKRTAGWEKNGVGGLKSGTHKGDADACLLMEKERGLQIGRGKTAESGVGREVLLLLEGGGRGRSSCNLLLVLVCWRRRRGP